MVAYACVNLDTLVYGDTDMIDVKRAAGVVNLNCYRYLLSRFKYLRSEGTGER